MSENIYSQNYDVIVLGGGAAGLMAAISASHRGRSVLVLEKSNMAGKKILMSGGGKCNFTNLNVSSDNFISENAHFPKSALSRYQPEDFVHLVKSHHIAFEERKHGQLFCVGSSREILNMLLEECKQGEIKIQTHFETHQVTKTAAQLKLSGDKNNFTIDGVKRTGRKIERFNYSCESLIVATGGLSIPTLGGSSFGYQLARKFSLGHVPTFAGLVPFVLTEKLQKHLEKLAGVSLHVEITCGFQVFQESLLFTHKGVSGPVVLQASNYWTKPNSISINLFPRQDFKSRFENWIINTPNSLLRSCLREYLPRSFVNYIEHAWWSEHKNTPIKKLPVSKLQELDFKFGEWKIEPVGTEGYKTAEVTLGGVDTNSISSKTFESRDHPGLYFVGEVLDVTGQLGGFNFQWAWASGHAAGTYA